MLKKLNFLFFCLGFLFTSLNAEITQIPTEFQVSQRWFSWSSDFDVETKDYKLGYVHRKVFSLQLQYDFNDNYDHLQAKGKLRWLSWGATFDVVDDQDQPIGMLKERIFTFFPTFEIVSPSGEILGVAKMNFWGTKYTVKDPISDQPYALLTRPFFRWKDDWTVTITDPSLFAQKNVDPRLFILVMVFQSDKEMWEMQNYNADQLFQQKSLTASANKKLTKSEKGETQNSIELDSLRIQLEAFRDQYSKVTVSEQDFDSVHEIVEQKLKSVEALFPKKGPNMSGKEYKEARLAFKAATLLPLLDSNELTLGQKGALFTALDLFLPKSQ